MVQQFLYKKRHDSTNGRLFTGKASNLEAFSVDNAGTALIIFLLGDPHLLEGGQGSQDGSSDPDRVLPLRGSNDLDLHGGWSQAGDLLLHSVSNTGVHGGAARQDSVGVQVLPDIDVALHNGVVRVLVDTTDLHSQEGRLEEGLGSSESLVADSDDLPVRELVALLQGAGAGGSLHLLLEVQSHVAEFLLDVTDDFPLSSGGEGIATLGQDLSEVVSEIPSSQVKTNDSMGQGIA